MTNIEKLLIDNGFKRDKKRYRCYTKGPVIAFVLVDTLPFKSCWDVSVEGLCFSGEPTLKEMKAKCDQIKYAANLLFEIAKKLKALKNPWGKVEELE